MSAVACHDTLVVGVTAFPELLVNLKKLETGDGAREIIIVIVRHLHQVLWKY